MKKILIFTLALVFLSAPAFAGNRPEYDAVGNDSQNFFNDFIKEWVDTQNPWNENSRFFEELFTVNNNLNPPLSADVCFDVIPDREYLSVLTTPRRRAVYQWTIVLQMQPATDLMLMLHSCALRTGEDDIWAAGFQSGFYTSQWDQQVFLSQANPRITALALPGPMAQEGFPAAGFNLDTRRHSGLQVAPLEDSLITLQALANESIVIALPSQGGLNALGQTTYSLSQGDRIKVIISIPGDTPVDTRFGKDSASLQYIGRKGTEYTTND